MKTWPIDLMCRVLGVKRNGFYRYQKIESKKIYEPIHAEMLEWIKEIAESSENSYGYRRMKIALNVIGYPVTKGETKKLMKEAGVGFGHVKNINPPLTATTNCPCLKI